MILRFFRNSNKNEQKEDDKLPEFGSLLKSYLEKDDYDDFWDELSDQEKESIRKGVEHIEKKK